MPHRLMDWFNHGGYAVLEVAVVSENLGIPADRFLGESRLTVLILVRLIGLSRIFLGVHWATDGLAGFAAGLFLLLGGLYFLGRGDGTETRPAS